MQGEIPNYIQMIAEASNLAMASVQSSAFYPATEGETRLVAEQLPPGLLNLGNSCYLNSLLQALASSQRFIAYLDERTRAVQYGRTRIHANAGALTASSHASHSSTSSLASTAQTDPWIGTWALAEEALGTTRAALSRLLYMVLGTLCRTGLWLQGWEPPPAPPPERTHRTHHMQQQEDDDQQEGGSPPKCQRHTALAALSPLAAAASAAITFAAASPTSCGRRPLPPRPPFPSPLHRLSPGSLLLQLQAVLCKLQPRYSRCPVNATGAAAARASPHSTSPSSAPSVDPSSLLNALRHPMLPGYSLRLGEQQDAAEALGCLCDALDIDLAVWHMMYGRWMQTPGSPESALFGAGPVESAALAAAAALVASPQPVPPASPLRGLIATTTTCCVCGGRSATQVEPFWSLPLPLLLQLPQATSQNRLTMPVVSGAAGEAAVASLTLPQLPKGVGVASGSLWSSGLVGSGGKRGGSYPSGGGLTLRQCLEEAMRADVVEAVTCSRCSLTTALRHLSSAATEAEATMGRKPPISFLHRAPTDGNQEDAGSASRLQFYGGSGSNRAGNSSLNKAPSHGGEPHPLLSSGTEAQRGLQPPAPESKGAAGRLIAAVEEPLMAEETEPAMAAAQTVGTLVAAPVAAMFPSRPPSHCDGPLQRNVARLEALLRGPHLPDLDLDRELSRLTQLMRQHKWRRGSGGGGGGCNLAAATASKRVGDELHEVETAVVQLAAVRSRMVRQTCMVRSPPVLVLQLLRSVWDPRVGEVVKDTRHVDFPLELGLEELQLLGKRAPLTALVPPPLKSQPGCKHTSGAAAPAVVAAEVVVHGEGGEEVSEEEVKDVVRVSVSPSYTLKAVIVHCGGPESGHYLVYRRIAMEVPPSLCHDNDGPVRGKGTTAIIGGGVGGGTFNSSGAVRSAWLRVSDSTVSLAEEREVLQQAAAVVLYEQEQEQDYCSRSKSSRRSPAT